MSDVCMIFFKSGDCDLGGATKQLRNYGLDVEEYGNHLIAYYKDSPKYRIGLVSGDYVKEEAIEIAEDTKTELQLKNCNARFEITIKDLELALDEINTLMEVQVALMEASNGFLFTPWNGNLTKA
jgi:hypothetical protein